ncbi:MAG TPA: DUF1810 domain-containing protein [Steroidobacteraceae bacterium]|jgi:uncharacterized protein (DUF1810 family)
MGSDPRESYALERFVVAQQPVFDRVVTELRQGCKATHWMWFIFPQLAGLGSSPMARTYAISGLDEARAYLQHPVLGQRLRQCVELVVRADAGNISQLFGYPDDLKFRSSLTLFLQASAHEGLFQAALDKYFGGTGDQRTLERL